ncbi:hypothetical protein NA78x_000400 [Anatilimnocola sp. NA78]|uniref:hypothetical protein n=1 Tax=Anatilimnocola sp. NA78 TaxID=3415683 RepID=UPI003CE5B8EA
MSKPQESNSRPAVVAAILIGLILLVPLLYVLSIGPVGCLANHGYIDLETARAFYWPIIKAHDAFPSLQPLIQGYIALFE